MIQVRPLGPQIGVEILGVDVKTLDDAGFAVIYRAWLDHNVAVVPGQDLQIEDFLRYSHRFGLVVPHPSKMTRHPDYPEITMLGINKFAADGQLDMAIYRRGAEGWHTDGAYDEEPFKATQLYALAVPSRGGDTFFASMYTAYDALPSRLKQRLEGRQGAFTYGGRRKADTSGNRIDIGRNLRVVAGGDCPIPAGSRCLGEVARERLDEALELRLRGDEGIIVHDQRA